MNPIFSVYFVPLLTFLYCALSSFFSNVPGVAVFLHLNELHWLPTDDSLYVKHVAVNPRDHILKQMYIPDVGNNICLLNIQG